MSVLQSIDWFKTRFDVLCVATESVYRMEGFRGKVVEFLVSKGYEEVVYTAAGAVAGGGHNS